MNKKIMKNLGFEEAVKDVEESNCPACKSPIKLNEFEDACSRKEFEISGLCSKCQKEIFGEDDG